MKKPGANLGLDVVVIDDGGGVRAAARRGGELRPPAPSWKFRVTAHTLDDLVQSCHETVENPEDLIALRFGGIDVW